MKIFSVILNKVANKEAILIPNFELRHDYTTLMFMSRVCSFSHQLSDIPVMEYLLYSCSDDDISVSLKYNKKEIIEILNRSGYTEVKYNTLKKKIKKFF